MWTTRNDRVNTQPWGAGPKTPRKANAFCVDIEFNCRGMQHGMHQTLTTSNKNMNVMQPQLLLGCTAHLLREKQEADDTISKYNMLCK
jgi:hypothetical protein